MLIERFPQARLIWDVNFKVDHLSVNQATIGELRAYSLDRTIILVHEYTDGNGWQAYAPVTDSGDIVETLNAIEARSKGLDYDYRG